MPRGHSEQGEESQALTFYHNLRVFVGFLERLNHIIPPKKKP